MDSGGNKSGTTRVVTSSMVKDFPDPVLPNAHTHTDPPSASAAPTADATFCGEYRALNLKADSVVWGGWGGVGGEAGCPVTNLRHTRVDAPPLTAPLTPDTMIVLSPATRTTSGGPPTTAGLIRGHTSSPLERTDRGAVAEDAPRLSAVGGAAASSPVSGRRGCSGGKSCRFADLGGGGRGGGVGD